MRINSWSCHSERSEESEQVFSNAQIRDLDMFRFAQHDNEKHRLIRVIRAIRGASKSIPSCAECTRLPVLRESQEVTRRS